MDSDRGCTNIGLFAVVLLSIAVSKTKILNIELRHSGSEIFAIAASESCKPYRLSALL